MRANRLFPRLHARMDERNELAALAVLDAIKAIREQAANERVAMQERGEALTDYSSGVLDGIDSAMLAAKKAVYRPGDNRAVTSPEEWWACEDAFDAGVTHAIATLPELRAAQEGEQERELDEAMDRASSVLGWQHLMKFSGQTREWMDVTLRAICQGALAATNTRAAVADPAPVLARVRAEAWQRAHEECCNMAGNCWGGGCPLHENPYIVAEATP